MAALTLRDVTKRVADGARRRTVLDGISLELAAGEVAVIRGPSGSGKTTLLAVAGGMLLPTSGEVLLDDEPTSRMRDAHRAEVRRKKVGFVFQDVQLIEGMSVRDNVLLPAVPGGEALWSRAESLLERFGMAALIGATTRQLSGGERQRVALARALLLDPSLLVLDEPTAHLDAPRAQQLNEELERLAAEGKAILVATHDPRVKPAHARELELADGKLTILQ